MIAAVMLGSLLIVAACEFWLPRRQREFPAVRRRIGNLAFWIVNLALAGFFLPSVSGVRAWLGAAAGFPLPSWPIAAAVPSLVAGFLLLDLLRYWVHRCEHAVPLFWRFHALHHSDPDVDVTTAVRHHPVEYLCASAFYWAALVVLDVPLPVALVHGLAVFASAAVQHGNIRLPELLERSLRPVLMTTDLHRVHHSMSPDHLNANYGAVLSIWDRLFGTLVRMTWRQHENIIFGVRELRRRDGLGPAAMMLTPWRLGPPAVGPW